MVRKTNKAAFLAVTACVISICGCGEKKVPVRAPESEPQERIILSENGIYYNSPEVMFARGGGKTIKIIENGLERTLYEADGGENAVPLIINPDFVYFAVETPEKTVVNRLPTINLGGVPETYGDFDRRLEKPYYVDASGGRLFTYRYYGSDQVRLIAFKLPRAEPSALSPPLDGRKVFLYPAPEPEAAYAVVGYDENNAGIYYFSEEDNTTSVVIEGIRFEDYYIENDRAFAIIGEKTGDPFAEDNRAELDANRETADPGRYLYNVKILDLKALGSVPVYSVTEHGTRDATVLGGSPDKLLDGDIATAWVLRTDAGEPERKVRIDFARPRPVRGLKVYSDPDAAEPGREYLTGPPVITVEMSDGYEMEITFDDGCVAFAEREDIETVEWIVLTVWSAPSEVESPTCLINEVQIY